MNKRLLIVVIVVILAALGLGVYLSQEDIPASRLKPSENELAKRVAELHGQSGPSSLPAPATLTPVDLSHPLRLAIGGLGLADNDKNQQLGDLVTVELTGAPGFNLVERQSLSAILRELNLNWSGFVRAKDAVRAGKLLKADWFLLGTEAKINGTNSIVARVVDARTGVMRDAGVFPADKPLAQVATNLASFMQESRQNAAHPQPRVFLAFGAFEDLSVNNRQADFPEQLRGYLTAAYRGSSVTLLEREYVETLLQEVHLDLAGLTEESWSNSPPAMQSAYWLVDGQYQSYETTNFQIELDLEIQRAFGKSFQRQLLGLPGDPIGRQTKSTIDEVMSQNAGNSFPTRRSEARMQMEIGRELCRNSGGFSLTWAVQIWSNDPQTLAKHKRNMDDAIRAFQTVLLLEPTNREAKIYLAACWWQQPIPRIEESRILYRELIDDPTQDKWSDLAHKALVETFWSEEPEQTLRWYQSAATQSTNSAAVAFYGAQAEAAQNEMTMRSGDSPKAEELAEKQLFDNLQAYGNDLQGKFSGPYLVDLGFDDYITRFKWDKPTAAQKLAELLPKFQKRMPELEPYLLAKVLTYQLDTNTPLLAEFDRILDRCIEHPEQILKPLEFWNRIHGSIYDWCFETTNYALAIKLIEGEKRVATSGKVVLLDFDDQEKIKLAYAYMAAHHWQDALDIFESYHNKPVKVTDNGPWGKAFQLVLTDKLAASCRQQLGMAAVEDARRFDFGKPVLCLCAPSTFVADGDSLWVGIGGQLLHLDFELRTNLVVDLQLDESVSVTALYLTPSRIWIGTHGAGLIEFDKATHQCHRLTESDGLMMNDIGSLEIAGDTLWIGYGGGLGRLDLHSRKLTSFMHSLNGDIANSTNEPPARAWIGKIVAGPEGNLWMLSVFGNSMGRQIRQYHIADGIWGTLPTPGLQWDACFCADSEHLVEGGGINLEEVGIQDRISRNAPTNDLHPTNMIIPESEFKSLYLNLQTNGSHRYVYTSGRPMGTKGGLAIQNLHDHRWQYLEDADGLPKPPSTLTLDGNNLWVGGESSIALVDLKEKKVKKFCYIQADAVDNIQIAGGYVWAQFDCHLYRAPLSALQ